MRDKSTDELNNVLENTKPAGLKEFYKSNGEFLADAGKAFYYYMKDVIDGKNIKLKDVYLYAGVSESWGSKIITMERHTKDRDMIIRLCVAAHFTLIEINRALKLYGMQPLYAKDRRDACLIVAINNRIYDFDRIDEILIEQKLKQLTKEE